MLQAVCTEHPSGSVVMVRIVTDSCLRPWLLAEVLANDGLTGFWFI